MQQLRRERVIIDPRTCNANLWLIRDNSAKFPSRMVPARHPNGNYAMSLCCRTQKKRKLWVSCKIASFILMIISGLLENSTPLTDVINFASKAIAYLEKKGNHEAETLQIIGQ